MRLITLGLLFIFISCAQEKPFLSGYMRRVHDGVMVQCDPYNKGDNHTCLVASSAFQNSLYVMDLSTGGTDMVMSKIPQFPLQIPVGTSTEKLVKVVSKDEKFPLLLALDTALPGFFSVRLFPHDKDLSFVNPRSYKFKHSPQSMAAVDMGDDIMVVASYPKEGEIAFLAFNKTSGDITVEEKNFNINGKPDHIAIASDKKNIVISNSEQNKLSVIGVDEAYKYIKGDDTQLNSEDIDLDGPTGEIFLSIRDIGSDKNLYAVIKDVSGKKIYLVDITNKLKAEKEFSDSISTIYFPSQDSEPCEGNKHWFSIATIKGVIHHVAINSKQDKLELEEITKFDLTSRKNLSLNSIRVSAIIGGKVSIDSKYNNSFVCRNNRQVFYLSSYANSKLLDYSPNEVEGHSRSCEGESSAILLGEDR